MQRSSVWAPSPILALKNRAALSHRGRGTTRARVNTHLIAIGQATWHLSVVLFQNESAGNQGVVDHLSITAPSIFLIDDNSNDGALPCLNRT